MFMKRDFRYGVPYYKFIGDSDSTELAAIFNNNKLSSIFSGLYVQTELLNGTGEKVIQYWDVGATPGELRADFQTKFANCQWMTPFYFDSTEGNIAAVARLNAIVNEVINENCYKYRKLAETLGFVYDPLTDYVENWGGTDELVREIEDKVNFKEINGPIYGVAFNTETNTYSFTFDETRQIESSGIDGSQTTKGGAYTGSTTTTTRGENTQTTTNSIALGTGTENQTKQYTTTYEDSATGRLAGYTTDVGTVAQAGDFISHTDLPITGRVREGNEIPGFTDTKTYGLTKEGRHVSAAELIEAQRQLARFSLEKEFFDDLKKKLVIAGWD